VLLQQQRRRLVQARRQSPYTEAAAEAVPKHHQAQEAFFAEAEKAEKAKKAKAAKAAAAAAATANQVEAAAVAKAAKAAAAKARKAIVKVARAQSSTFVRSSPIPTMDPALKIPMSCTSTERATVANLRQVVPLHTILLAIPQSTIVPIVKRFRPIKKWCLRTTYTVQKRVVNGL
jgi:hypothetical protein